MSDPWFPAWMGGVIGGVVGLLGGMYGCVVGTCAPRGIGRRAVMTFHFTLLALGVTLLTAAVVAFFVGQPYGVWYGLGLSGLILTILMSAFTPMIRTRYREAEERKMIAKDLT